MLLAIGQIFVVVVWNFEIYMVPLSLLLLLTWNYFLLASGKESREGSVVSVFMGVDSPVYIRDVYLQLILST